MYACTYNCEFLVYTVGVKGDYVFDGKKLLKQSNVRTNNSTHYIGWSVASAKARWTDKGSKYSNVRNNSVFKYGLNTQWVKLNIQTYNEEINASVKVK